ncbi:unnamed protein product, partial [Toxocara canis]|uniref:Uncharacterized protein n=1 Tax=Toxocara canis TaxID=6265 RepID=A0A183U691_TOXCA
MLPVCDVIMEVQKQLSAGENLTSGAIVEDTLVAVVGKLRSFNERLCIVAFDVREVEDRREVDAFKLEAKLARLYYTKKWTRSNWRPSLLGSTILNEHSLTILSRNSTITVCLPNDLYPSFFTLGIFKNVVDVVLSGDLSRFEGTILRGQKDGDEAAAGGEAKPGGWNTSTGGAGAGAQPARNTTVGGDVNCRGLTGQKAE